MIQGSDVRNEAVSPWAKMHLGKAFMLDDAGHGSWDAVLHLGGKE